MIQSYTRCRFWLSLCMGLVAVFTLFVLKPASHGNIQGIILPATNIHPASSVSDVVVYASAPKNAINLGEIRLEVHDNHSHVSLILLTKKARVLAASVGANGVLLKGLYHTNTDKIAKGLSAYEYYAKAIYVPPMVSRGGRG